MQIKMSLCAAMKWQKVTILVCTLALFPVLSINSFAQEETQNDGELLEATTVESTEETLEEGVVESAEEGLVESLEESAETIQDEVEENQNQEAQVTGADNQTGTNSQTATNNQESAASRESTEQEAPVRAPRARPQSGQVVNLSSTIVGNQEQPQVLYIVPWKPVGDSDLENQNIQSQLDIIFGHVERVELRRELLYMKQFASEDEETESN